MFFAEGFFLPKFDGELLNGDAGCVAHMAVAVAEVAPGGGEGFLGIGAAGVQGLDGVAHAGLFVERSGFDGCGGFLADISHAIDAGL